eukprot:gene135-222_t
MGKEAAALRTELASSRAVMRLVNRVMVLSLVAAAALGLLGASTLPANTAPPACSSSLLSFLGAETPRCFSWHVVEPVRALMLRQDENADDEIDEEEVPAIEQTLYNTNERYFKLKTSAWLNDYDTVYGWIGYIDRNGGIRRRMVAFENIDSVLSAADQRNLLTFDRYTGKQVRRTEAKNADNNMRRDNEDCALQYSGEHLSHQKA